MARKYSRDAKYEADRRDVELELPRRAGDAREMMSTLTWLMQTSGPGRVSFLDMHSATGDCIEAPRTAPEEDRT